MVICSISGLSVAITVVLKANEGPPGDAVTTAIKSFQNYDLWIIHRFPIPISEFIEWDEKLCFIRSTS